MEDWLMSVSSTVDYGIDSPAVICAQFVLSVIAIVLAVLKSRLWPAHAMDRGGCTRVPPVRRAEHHRIQQPGRDQASRSAARECVEVNVPAVRG